MMNDHGRILVLTRIAALNAVFLSFLSVQFVLPVAFVLLLWIAPAIFAFQIYYAPPRFSMLSGLIVTTLSFTLFGVDVGVWAIVYLLSGSVLGFCWRIKCHWFIRLSFLSLVYAAALLAVLLLFAWIAQISWQEIGDATARFNVFPLPFISIIVVGLMGWAWILSIASNWFFARVLHQLPTKNRSL